MEYYEGNRTRNWKEKQEQDGNERNGYWAKSHENADAIKRFLFLFYFFFPPGANDINGNNNKNSHNF